MKFIGHVLELCDQIMWMVTCQDHVISRSRDHDITNIWNWLHKNLCIDNQIQITENIPSYNYNARNNIYTDKYH